MFLHTDNKMIDDAKLLGFELFECKSVPSNATPDSKLT